MYTNTVYLYQASYDKLKHINPKCHCWDFKMPVVAETPMYCIDIQYIPIQIMPN